MDLNPPPLMHEDLLPEARARCFTWPMLHYSAYTSSYENEPTVAQLLAATPSSSSTIHPLSSDPSTTPTSTGALPATPVKKKRCRRKPADQLAQKKPNPWGEESYSDLIAKALESAVDGRLKLNEIYQWFSDNVPYFGCRSSQEDAAGWKNSIRHNLSLHSRFMRIQNEGAGKSSWWVINPDAKPGRNPRRQRASTMDTTTKAAFDKKRRGAKKRVSELRGASTLSIASSTAVGASNSSIIPHEFAQLNPQDDSLNYDIFRSRAHSTSVVSSTPLNRASPSIDHFDDFDFPPWVDAAASNPPIPSDILDRTDQMRIDAPRPLNGLREMKQEMKCIKTDMSPVAPPPLYQELASVNANSGESACQNPLLRQSLLRPAPVPQYLGGMGSLHGYGWPAVSCGVTASHAVSAQSALPIDLENLTLPDQPLIDMDMETILRHELSQTTNNQLNFDI